MNDLQRQFAAVLRRHRDARGLSQEKLSELAGLHRTYVGLLERAMRMPSILVAQQIAKALGLTMSAFLGEVEREPVAEEAAPDGRSGRGTGRKSGLGEPGRAR